MLVNFLLFFSITASIALVVLTGTLFHYRAKAQKLDLLERILFGASLERSLELTKKHWDTDFSHFYKKLIENQLINRIHADFKSIIENQQHNSATTVELLQQIARHAQSSHPLASTMERAARSFFKNKNNAIPFLENIITEYSNQPLGKQLVFFSQFILEDNPPFIIEKIIGTYFFENRILSLIKYHMPIEKKIDRLNTVELAALKKITTFFNRYDSGILETARVTRYLAGLFESLEVEQEPINN